MNSFYTKAELKQIGFKSFGENVFVSRKASIYGAENISIGNNVRIDDFCVLSGFITIENYVHIAPFCGLYAGTAGIEIKNFGGLSSRCNIYAMSDDFTGNYLVSPVVPDEFRRVKCRTIIIEEYGLIGCASTLLPGAHINVGVALGTMSMLSTKTIPWKIYSGIPAKVIKDRTQKMLASGEKLLNE